MTDLDRSLDDLVTANRILAHEQVLDGFGHVSIRHPGRADRFFLSCSRSPELVTTDDLMEYDLACNPIDQRGKTMYAERAIHGAIYEHRPDVKAVIHNHAFDLLPFTLTDVRLRPMIHLAGSMGPEIPVWDIETKFGVTDLLVRNMEQGRDLAGSLARNSIALMRGHGAVVIGHTLQEAVSRAIYAMVNARLQLQVMQFNRPIKFLSDAEIGKTTEMALSPLSVNRAWEYWARRAGR